MAVIPDVKYLKTQVRFVVVFSAKLVEQDPFRKSTYRKLKVEAVCH